MSLWPGWLRTRVPGAPDPIYLLARRVLLDALNALGGQRNALILVGAQAIYLHTGDADMAVAEYTTDADIAINPLALHASPKIEEALKASGFVPDVNPGTWFVGNQIGGQPRVQVDLLVPEALGGPGRRGARLGTHGNRAARKVRGLEAALVDRRPMTIASLDASDSRRFELNVAGPSALLVAKLHKIIEREENPGRREDKDALDVLRLLRAVPTEQLAESFRALRLDEIAGTVTREAERFLRQLFSTPASVGSQMAARAAAPEPADTIAASCGALTRELLDALGS